MTTADEPRATNLTDETLAQLRDRARREAGPFIDPVRLPQLKRIVVGAQQEWMSAVLGRPVHDWRRIDWSELVLLGLARDAEPVPPVPPRVLAARDTCAEQRRAQVTMAQDRAGSWQDLRSRLPVKVEVAHNYTSHRHVEGYVQGADHIIVLEDLHDGRLHRAAGRPLCWTPSRAANLEVFDDAGDHRVPGCQACLRTAERIARPQSCT